MQDGTNINAGSKVVSALNSIPFGSIIGGPLAACVHAQAEAAQTTMDFIRGFTMTDSSLDIEGREPVTVTFSFIMEGVPMLMTVPLMTIVPIPYMRINYVDLSFTADITACDSEKMEAKYASEGYKRTEEDEKSISMQSKMGISIRAATSDMPSGMAKMLDFFGNNLIIQETLTAEEVDEMRWEADRQRAIIAADCEEQKRIEEERERERKRRKEAEKKRHDKIAALVQAVRLHKEQSEEERIREQKLKEEKERWRKEAQEKRIRENRPDPRNPFALPETNRKKPHPECTFDPEQSIQWNIDRQETLRGSNRHDWLRNHLLLALRTAQRIYPNDINSTDGQRILKEDLANFGKRYNGWYTYGELNNKDLPKGYRKNGYIDTAYTDFVGYVLDNERRRNAPDLLNPTDPIFRPRPGRLPQDGHPKPSDSSIDIEYGRRPSRPIVRPSIDNIRPVARPSAEGSSSYVRPGRVGDRPVVRPSRVEDRPVTRPSAEGSSSYVRPGRVGDRPVVRPGRVEDRPVARPNAEESISYVRPSRVEDRPVARPNAEESSSYVRPGRVEDRPVVRPSAEGSSSYVRPGRVEDSPVTRPGVDSERPVARPNREENSSFIRPSEEWRIPVKRSMIDCTEAVRRADVVRLGTEGRPADPDRTVDADEPVDLYRFLDLRSELDADRTVDVDRPVDPRIIRRPASSDWKPDEEKG